jgi:hypothetical protein
MPDYNLIEDNLMKVLSKKFNFEYPKNKEVDREDYYLLEWEWNVLMLKNKKWGDEIKLMSQKNAKNEFLKLFNFYQNKKKSLPKYHLL